MKQKCKCTFMKETGWLYKECKYHKERCHYSNCRKKLKKYKDYRPNETRYCKKHDEVMHEECRGLMDAFGGSDFI